MITSVVGQILLGWLLADFVIGFFHWVEDRSGIHTVPLLNKLVIGVNKDHHAYPNFFIDEGSFISRNRFMIILSLLVGIPALCYYGLQPWIISMMIGSAFVNEVHAWTHAPRISPSWVAPLQETGFIQSPKQHALHHRPPEDKNYCLLTDWLNPILEKIKFFPRLEKLFRIK